MIRLTEFLAFVAVAVALHLAVALWEPQDTGLTAAGDAGQAVISMQVSDAQLADMVERWETPPDLSAPVDAPDMPQVADMDPPPSPTAPSVDPMPRATATAPQGLALPAPESVPDASVTAPPPPPVAKPTPNTAKLADTRPRERPKRSTPPKPKAKADPARKPAAASTAQRAAGQGQGADAGNARASQATSLNAGQIQSLTAQWGAKLRRKVERRKRYPSAARGASGTVLVRLTVGRDGSLRGVALARSSGNAALDQAAVRAVQSAGRFPAAPKGLSKPSYSFTLPMQFNR